MDNVCSEIVNQDGISWHFDRRHLNVGSLLLKDVMGVRDTPIKDQNCFEVVDAGGSLYSYVNMGARRNPGTGNFVLGIFFNFPGGAGGGAICPIFACGWLSGIYVYQQNGDIYASVLEDGESTQTVNTTASGNNYADGTTYLLFVERDVRYATPKLKLEIFDSYQIESDISEIDITNSELFYIGARLDAVPAVQQYGYPATKLFGAFYLIGRNLDFNDKWAFWKKGTLPFNAEFFAQLDEAATLAIYDSDQNALHGEIENFSAAARGTISDGFSWQNMYGFSTGAYVKGEGTTTVPIPSGSHTIDDAELIPYVNYIPDKDIFGHDLEFEGRCRINLQIKDIMCYKGDATTSGNVTVAHTALNYTPGTDEFCVFWVAESIVDEGGCIIANGESPNWRYRFDYNPAANEITWNVGSETGSVACPAGMNLVVINIGTTTFEIFANGSSLGTFDTGSSVTASSELRLFALNDNSQILSDGSVAVVGVRDSAFSSAERTAFFTDGTIPTDIDACWICCSNSDILFDVSKSNYHATLINYDSGVWTGVQSVLPYMFAGYSKVLEELTAESDYVNVPYDVDGKKIPYDAFGSTQLDSEHASTEGLNLFDCYIDLNPYDVDLGFYTYFWDKSNAHWKNLDSAYDAGDDHYWHTNELNMNYIENALVTAWLNYLFIDTSFDRWNFGIEIKDMLLLNLGTNQKYVPIPIHY